MEKKYIIFDFDNTIMDSLWCWYKVMNEDSFVAYGQKPNKQMVILRKGLTNYKVAELFIKLSGVDLTPEQVLELWYTTMETNYKTIINPIKGALEYIRFLKEQGYTLVIASATREKTIRVALEHFGISDIFSHIFTEENTHGTKLDKSLLSTCLNTLGAKPEECFFFEDSISSLKNANALQIDTCCVVHKFNKSRIKEVKRFCKLIIKNYADKKLNTLGL